jgi:hypothetical protein
LKVVQEKYARQLDENDMLKLYVTRFLGAELIPLNEQEVETSFTPYEAFSTFEHSRQHLLDLVRQIIQHNIMILQRYYSRIQLARLAKLVGVSEERAEIEVGDMVVNERIHARINRMTGLLIFRKRQFTNDSLNAWNFDLRSLLDKIETTCHLINREKVVHQ